MVRRLSCRSTPISNVLRPSSPIMSLLSSSPSSEQSVPWLGFRYSCHTTSSAYRARSADGGGRTECRDITFSLRATKCVVWSRRHDCDIGRHGLGKITMSYQNFGSPRLLSLAGVSEWVSEVWRLPGQRSQQEHVPGDKQAKGTSDSTTHPVQFQLDTGPS